MIKLFTKLTSHHEKYFVENRILFQGPFPCSEKFINWWIAYPFRTEREYPQTMLVEIKYPER